MNCMMQITFLWMLALIKVSTTSPYSRYEGNPLSSDESYDTGLDASNMAGKDTSSQDEDNSLLYEAIISEILNDVNEINPDEMNADLKSEIQSEPLTELNALETAALEDEIDDGNWLDDVKEIVNSLPSNFHNSSEYQTKFGNEDMDVKQSIDKWKNGGAESDWVFENVQLKPDSTDGNLFGCSSAHPCEEDEYCFETEFDSICVECQEVGTQCVDDAQCCSEGNNLALCVAFRCTTGVRPGSLNTICDVLEDCETGLCCADVKGHPRRVCKGLAKLHERCSLTPDWAVEVLVLSDNDYFCPCEGGLSCQQRKATLFDRLVAKNNEVLFCSEAPYVQKNQHRLNLRQNNQDLLDPRWSDRDLGDIEARLESEDDQRFQNQGSSDRHRNVKKAMEVVPSDDWMM